MTGEESSGTNQPDESLVRSALDARAATAVIDPEPWARFEQARQQAPRRSATPGWRGHAPLLAVAAAAAVVLLMAALVWSGAGQAQRVGTEDGDHRSTTPATVVTGPDEPGPGEPTTTTPPPTTTVAPAPGGLAGIDLRNATYPSTVCPSDGMRPADPTFTLVNGEAMISGGGPGEGRVHLSLDQVAMVDLDGDGRSEAVARFTCGYAQSDVFDTFIAVFGEAGGAPTVLVTTKASGTNPAPLETAYVSDDRTEDVQTTSHTREEQPVDVVALAGGRVRITWLESSGMGTPELGYYNQIVTYRWDGRRLAIDQVGERTVVVARTAPGPEHYAIRRAGIRSMTLPLGGGGDDRSRVCADVFTDAPVPAQVALADGVAAVPGAGGPGVDGWVRVVDVFYTDLMPAAGEEAVLVVRCESPQRAVHRPVLVRLVDGRPTLADALLPDIPTTTVSGVERRQPDQVWLTWQSLTSGVATTSRGYRWDGSHLVPV